MKEDHLHHKSFSAWVLPLSWLCAFVPLGLIIFFGLQGTGGIFTYPVDDTYIHLKISQNLAVYGNWGINPGEFNSASSSLLYTLLLAALVKIFASPLFLPLIINVIAGTVLLVVIAQWLTRQGISAIFQFFILLLLIFLTPLPVLMLSGMEHVLQCLFAFLFLVAFTGWQGRQYEGKIPWQIILFSVLLVATRYEGLFIVAGACLVLLFNRKFSKAFMLGAFAFLPVIVFGLISAMKGSYFLPNSVLVKSEAAQFSMGGLARSFSSILVEKFMFAKAGITLLATQRLLILLPLTWIIFRKSLQAKPSWSLMLMVLTIATFLQLALADTGKFYRYEAYLVLLSVIVIGLAGFSYTGKLWNDSPVLLKTFGALIVGFLVFPLLLRTLAGFSKASRAMVNIYEQQFQMAGFLQKYYPVDAIAANDIGAISYFRNGRIVDLWGLGTFEIARSKKSGYWNAAFLDSISREKNARIAIIYDSWLRDAVPEHWKKVANWQITNNVVAGDDNVSFYAIDHAVSNQLKVNLAEFQKQLPATVKVAYY